MKKSIRSFEKKQFRGITPVPLDVKNVNRFLFFSFCLFVFLWGGGGSLSNFWGGGQEGHRPLKSKGARTPMFILYP